MNRAIVLGSLPIASMVTKELLSRDDVKVEGVILCPYKTDNDPWAIDPLAWFAAKNKIAVLTMSEVVEKFEVGELDCAFLCRYSELVKNDFIKRFKKGVVNFHGGILPGFGGLYSSCHTILKGDDIGGGTLHYVSDETIDTGDVIDFATFKIENEDTSLIVFQKTQKFLYDSFIRNLDNILKDNVNKISQKALVELGASKRYFDSKSLDKEIKIDGFSQLYKKARAYDFFGHERAFVCNGSSKIYVTTTPIHKIETKSVKFNVPIEEFLSDKVDIRNFRDDLYPLVGGGNKARKIQYIIKNAVENRYNALVTNGGTQSNHARATALIAAQHGLKCSIVLHSDEPEAEHPVVGNLMVMKMAGADIRFCRLSELASVMDEEIDKLTTQGYNPLYIWGGGHCVQGSLAYYDAAKEAREQCGEWVPDYVVHASGTGTTQAGLIAGYADLSTKVVGVSVAREKERGSKVVSESLIELGQYLNKDFSKEVVCFRDEWILGGYERYSQALMDTISKAGKKGLILDPTYTGKAWFGLFKMIESGEIPEGSKVLFWHTGGLLNLLAHPAYIKLKI
ncbi:pyridoxal-phosphate dependent enzyme [Desulfoluna spongiiphila]|uniref:pyridoxal-phosphate dependent enzyme n=1 Tax=Desulfoluna spongiiphila TaxID=419481 RepID=UPI001253C37A|nr:pyridoxal-phosphate dependent enzyme [Desulfoluna spongiiphila]VVS95288.1 pyridoxal-phosphate dependent enzyme [Desulfoluna spongiiphila]